MSSPKVYFTLEELAAFMLGPSEISSPTNEPSLGVNADENAVDYEEPSFGDSFGDEDAKASDFGDEDAKASDFGDSRKRSSVAIGPLNVKKPRGLFSPPASFAIAAQPVEATCEICGDESVLHRCTVLACQHMFCKPCLSHWITTQVEQRQRRISCPAVGCGHSLNQEDIVRLSIDPAVPVAYSALMAETYEDRLAEMSSDPELKAWMDANARPCPKCSLLITRTSGCNTVRCPCGHRFCYCCGQERCVKMPPVVASASAFQALLAQQTELWREAEKQGRRIDPITGKFK